MNKVEILIIDDEPQIRKLLQIVLESNDYKVIQASTGKEGLVLSASHPPDLILLDIGLPDKSGHEILKELREWYNKPIIILSVQDNEADIVSALDNGATDYLTKPFRTGELLARIRSAIRRSQNTNNNSTIICGDIEIDLIARIVKRKGETIKLTSTEYKLLEFFMKNQSRVLSRMEILENVWDIDFNLGTNVVDVYVNYLRKKIDKNKGDKLIHTMIGMGYMMKETA